MLAVSAGGMSGRYPCVLAASAGDLNSFRLAGLAVSAGEMTCSNSDGCKQNECGGARLLQPLANNEKSSESVPPGILRSPADALRGPLMLPVNELVYVSVTDGNTHCKHMAVSAGRCGSRWLCQPGEVGGMD